jgi:DNA-binding transcriptional MerR regulator
MSRPVKLWYRIGEVARLVDVDTSVLRHWEHEFRALRPRRTKSGQRIYSQNDIQKILEIKRLLYEKRFTTRGAVQQLRVKGLEPRPSDDPVVMENRRLRSSLLKMRTLILDYLAFLEEDETK